MRIVTAGALALALVGTAAAPAVAQPKAPHAATNRVKVFAEPG